MFFDSSLHPHAPTMLFDNMSSSPDVPSYSIFRGFKMPIAFWKALDFKIVIVCLEKSSTSCNAVVVVVVATAISVIVIISILHKGC